MQGQYAVTLTEETFFCPVSEEKGLEETCDFSDKSLSDESQESYESDDSTRSGPPVKKRKGSMFIFK